MNTNQLISKLKKYNLVENEPLSKHTYFKIGGPADLMVTAETTDDLVEIVTLANNAIPFTVLGGGSNVLVTDKGYRGLVIKNKSNNITLKGFVGGAGKGGVTLKHVLLASDSGVPANKLIRHAVEEGLEGLEDFLGLPGTVGGAIYNNSHHIGKLIGDAVQEVEVIDAEGTRKKYTQTEMDFSYDYSVLQKTQDVVLTATFKLQKSDQKELWKKATAAVKRRADTQPLGIPSSGCIFKNFDLADAIRLGTPNQTCSAGYLIDKTGLKGERRGGAMISERHANFIVNTGGATFEDVMYLVNRIKKKIKADFGVDLEMEVFILGER